MFCYKCGKECELIDGLCPDCYSELSHLILFDPKYNVIICSNCDTYLLGEWKEFNVIEDIIEDLVKQAAGKRKTIFVDATYEPDDLSLQVHYDFEMHEEYVNVELEAYGLPDAYSKLPRREQHAFVLYPKYTTCPRCSKMYGGYYEAIFQIRKEGRFLSREESDAFVEEVRKISEAELEKNSMAFVTKIIKRKEGPNLQMGSLKFTKKLARALQKQYGGNISESYRLTGYDRQEGKARYRATVVLRLSEFEAGRFVFYEDSLWKIVHSMDKVTLGNFDSTISLDFKKIEKESSQGNLRLVDESELTRALVVSLDEGGCQLMSYDNYSSLDLDLEKVPIGMSQGDEVLILKTPGGAYPVNP